MAKEKINLRDELREHKFEFDLLQKIPCTKQQNKECKCSEYYYNISYEIYQLRINHSY